MRKLTVEEVKNRIKKVHGDVVVMKEATFKGPKIKATFIDKDFGKWEAIPESVYLLKTGHPDRGRQKSVKSRTLTIKEVKKRIKDVHGNMVKICEETFKSTGVDAKFIDKDFGVWWTHPSNVFLGSGHPTRGRFKAAKNTLLSIEEVADRLPNYIKIVPETYSGIYKECSFIDEEFGIYETKPSLVFIGGGNHSKRRSRNKTKAMAMPLEELKDKIALVNPGIAIVEDTYSHCGSKATFICKIYGEFRAKPSKILIGQGHPDGKTKKRIKTLEAMPGSGHGLENFKKRLIGLDNGIVLDESTYKDSRTKAKFICKKYGEFWSTPRDISRGHGHPDGATEKRQKTSLKKYGFDHPLKNRDIAIKSASKSAQTTKKIHWKTGEELVCQASWEPKVVDYLNANQIDFQWQPSVFEMPDGKTYRPDFYLIEKAIWVEIKGYFRKDAQEKWDWFKSEHPRAELWDKKKLKELRIL